MLRHPTRVGAAIRIGLLWRKTYFGAQKKVALGDALLIETTKDDLIAIQEGAIYPYLFAGVYIVYVIWFLLDKLEDDRYASATDAYENLIRESVRIFEENPTRMRDRERIRHPLTRFLHTIDGPTNCYPSLHVSLMVLSYQILKDEPKATAFQCEAMKQACIDVCRSTMQTKQHSIIDVIGGFAITRMVFEGAFAKGRFDNFIEEILPELNDGELTKVKNLMNEHRHDLTVLLDELLTEFTQSE